MPKVECLNEMVAVDDCGKDKMPWPSTSDYNIWIKQWKDDVQRFPDLPFDDSAMAEWFKMAIAAGSRESSDYWMDEYYRVYREKHDLEKKKDIIFTIVSVVAIIEAAMLYVCLLH
jgi:hypothetical protein